MKIYNLGNSQQGLMSLSRKTVGSTTFNAIQTAMQDLSAKVDQESSVVGSLENSCVQVPLRIQLAPWGDLGGAGKSLAAFHNRLTKLGLRPLTRLGDTMYGNDSCTLYIDGAFYLIARAPYILKADLVMPRSQD